MPGQFSRVLPLRRLRRIGWEVQLSTAGGEGQRSVRARASKAAKNGITPAWHTDRSAYAYRNDTQWTRSDKLPAYVIARTGDLRVVSGFRAMDFWICELHADYPCPDGVRRCGRAHATPKPRDMLFDDLVRRTAAGGIVPVQFRVGTKVHRFWVTDIDRDRLEDLHGDDTRLPPLREEDQPRATASPNRPTCRVDAAMTAAAASVSPDPARPASLIPVQPTAPAAETEIAHTAEPAISANTRSQSAVPPAGEIRTDLPAIMITLQQTADCERRRLERLDGHEERREQRRVWFKAAASAQGEVTRYARAKRLNRAEVAGELRRVVGNYRDSGSEQD
ncbi:hypothetical protein ACWIID_30175 [Streptomyces phaeochromogenes]